MSRQFHCLNLLESMPQVLCPNRPQPPTPELTTMPLSSWAKRIGFRPKFSGETNANNSGLISPLPPTPKPKEPDSQVDLKSGRACPTPTVNDEQESEKVKAPTVEKDQQMKRRWDSYGGVAPKYLIPSVNGVALVLDSQPRRPNHNDEVDDVLSQIVDDDGLLARHSHMKYEVIDTPSIVPIGMYGI